MTCRAALAWDSDLVFTRFIEDCGVPCELVTPHMLAAPFYRGSFVTLVIPTGFGNPAFSGLLPALRASQDRIRRFVERGGNLLVFGAMSPNEKAYDWLPFPVRYHHEYFRASVTLGNEKDGHILEDFDCSAVECDGHFSECDGGRVVEGENGRALMVRHSLGKGTVYVTAIHEYPSRRFIRTFCTGDTETLF
jgi:hypothetical protein